MMHSCRSANTFECKYKYELFVQQSGSYWFEYFIGVGGDVAQSTPPQKRFSSC